jgi:hypothetical protein
MSTPEFMHWKLYFKALSLKLLDILQIGDLALLREDNLEQFFWVAYKIICTPGLWWLFTAAIAIGCCDSHHACSFTGNDVPDVIANID